MITKQRQDITKNTDLSTENNPLQNEKRTFFQGEYVQSKQFVQKQEKCKVRKKDQSYFKAILSIRYQSERRQITIKPQERRYKQFAIDCNLIKKVLNDKFKILIIFNQAVKHFQEEKSKQLHIKLADLQTLEIWKELLSNFINRNYQSSNKQVSESLKTQKAQVENLYQTQQKNPKQKMLKVSLKYSDKIRKQKQNQIEAIQELNKLLQKQLQSLSNKLSQIENQLIIRIQQNKRLSLKLDQMNQKQKIMQELKIKIISLQKRLIEKEAQKMRKNQQKNQQIQQRRQMQILQLTNQVANSNKKITQIELFSKKTQQQLNLKKQENKLMIKLKKDNQVKIRNLQADLEVQNEQYEQKQIKLKQTEENYLILLEKYNFLQQKYNRLKQQSHQKDKKEKQAVSLQKHSELQRVYNQMRYLHIFEGPVLQEYLEYKQFLKETIEKYTRKIIVKTVPIYKFDKKNIINFHNYIDGYQNFVVIGKTLNGVFFAGFSQSYVKPNQRANKGGLILSLTNYRAFELIKNMRSVTFDDYFMIFGNSEIRITSSQECKVFSNFGTSNGYYYAQGQTVNILLGEGTVRQAKLENYEFHQVIFQYR